MRTTHIILTIAIGISILTGCNKNNSLNIEESPNYAFVFNDNEVQRIDIKISSEYWTVMQEDLVEVLSSSSGSFGFRTKLLFMFHVRYFTIRDNGMMLEFDIKETQV